MDAPFYDPLDHTADLGWVVWGNSWEELCENAGRALTDTLVALEKVEPRQEVEWSVRAPASERLLVRHLEEILFQFDAKGMVFSRFQISRLGTDGLSCRAWGEPLDRDKHGFKTEIKAVTYHQLKIERESDGRYSARVILDV
jgi:SHS2 domain-containing protein